VTTVRRQRWLDLAKARTGEPRFGFFIFRAISTYTFQRVFFLAFSLFVLATCLLDSAFAQNTLSTKQTAQQAAREYEVTFTKGLISIRADNAKLKPLLEEIGRKTGVQISISADLGERILSVHVSNLDLESALRAVLRSAGIDSHAWVYRPSQKAGQLGNLELSTIHVVAQGSERRQLPIETSPQQRAANEKQTLLPAKTVPGRELFFDKRSNKYVEVAEREIQVRFKKELSDEQIADTLRRFGATVISRHEKLKIYRFKIPATESVASFMEKHSANDKLVTLEPNFFASSKATVLPPNDPLFSQQWSLQKIEAFKAWEVTTGSADVVVADLDTGTDHNHPDLQTQVIPGRNILLQNSNTMDDHGHGTAMAGVIGASANNGVGIAGLCWACRLMPVKVLDASGEGTYADVIEGVLWASDNGAKILNLSLGGYVYSQLMADAIDYAHAAGAVIVAAGGNEDTSDPLYPAAFPNVIGVSATNQDDSDWSPSNQGAYIKLAAPGVIILTTGLDAGYVQPTGTSLSTAQVSGIASLVLSKNLNLSNTQVEEILYRTAEDLKNKGKDSLFAYGRINAAKALEMADVNFHDVALARIRIEPQKFKAGETTKIIVTVENLGSFVEKNLSVKAFINEVPLEGLREIQSIGPGDSIDLSFHWRPPTDSAAIVVHSEVGVVESEIETRNNVKSVRYAMGVEDGEVSIRYGLDTHLWIGEQAKFLLPDSAMKDEIWNFIGSRVAQPGCSASADSGSKILEGVYEEDDGLSLSNFTCKRENRYLRHFWDPDAGYNVGLTFPLNLGTQYESAVNRAERFWDTAKSEYRGANFGTAYWWLGRVGHLLMDMGVPAHVHLDCHGGVPGCGADSYEVWMEDHYSEFAASGSLTDYNTLDMNAFYINTWNLGPTYKNQALAQTNLFKLFLHMAEWTDEFESDGRPGETHSDGVGDVCNFLSDTECRNHANSIVPRLMKHVAGLYKLFWDETHPPLSSGVAKNDSVAPGAWKFYSFSVPSGATSLTVTTTNASADVDLYVKFNQTPTSNLWDCRPFSFTGIETCTFSNPSAGTWIIGVKNIQSGTQPYTITASHSTASTPVVTSVSPSPVIGSNDRQWLTLNGSGFASGFTVTLRDVTNGVTYPTITDPGRLQFVSASQVQVFANVSANPATWSVKVTNPGGLSSSDFNFSVVAPTPVISSLNPNAATAGGPGFILTVNGSKFNLSSVVRWNGSSRTTTRVETSPGSGLVTRLQATISSSDIAAAGNGSVTVFNPSPGGGVSSPLTFTVGTLGALAVTPATGLISSG
jgi:Subtilase family/Bacterial pre-peptidase C-terminal domain/CARDB